MNKLHIIFILALGLIAMNHFTTISQRGGVWRSGFKVGNTVAVTSGPGVVKAGAGWHARTWSAISPTINNNLVFLQSIPFIMAEENGLRKMIKTHWILVCCMSIAFLTLGLVAIITTRLNMKNRALASRLVENAERLAATLHSIGDAVISVDTDCRVRQMNTAAEKLTGCSRETAIGKHVSTLATIRDAETLNPVENPIPKLFDSKAVPVSSQRNILSASDGKEHHVTQTHTLIKCPDGSVNGAVWILHDVSEQQRIENDLKHHVQLERIVSEVFSDFIKSKPENIDYAIRRALKRILTFGHADRGLIFNFTQGEKEISDVYEACAEEVAPVIKNLRKFKFADFQWLESQSRENDVLQVDNVLQLPDDATPLKKMFLAQDIKSFLAIPMMKNNQFSGVFVLGGNKAGRKWGYAERELLHFTADTIGEALRRQIIETNVKKLSDVATRTDNIVIIIDADGIIEWVNRAFCQITGYSEKEALGERPEKLWRGPGYNNDVSSNTIRSALKNYHQFDGEILTYTKTGQELWVDMEIRPIYDAKKNISHYIAVNKDITRRKWMEQKLAEVRHRETQTAARVQKTLLRGKQNDSLPGIKSAAMSMPSQEVDGDFFDTIIHQNQFFDIVLGDVMGKGIRSALLAAAAKSSLVRALNNLLVNAQKPFLPQPREIVNSLHAGMVRELIDLDSFITLCYARINAETLSMDYVDCGHMPIIHYNAENRSATFLSGENVPLGFLDGEYYEQKCVNVNPGDVIVFYSDGITEAKNRKGDMFGRKALVEIIDVNCDKGPEKILEAISNAASQHARGQFHDDVTCLVVKIEHLPKAVNSRDVFYHTCKPVYCELRPLRKSLQDFLNQHLAGVSTRADIDTVILCVNEACTNIIEHAFSNYTTGLIEVRASIRRGHLEITLIHNGDAFTAVSNNGPEPSCTRESGYGIHIMETGMDTLQYARTEDHRNCVRMVKCLH